MKFRTTIILLVLVIGLGAFLLVYTARQPSASAFKEEQSQFFAESEFQALSSSGMGGLSDLATELELHHGNDVIVIERPHEGLNREWRIVKPLNLLADSGAVAAILGEIEFLKVTRRFAPEKGEAYGLKPPERWIMFGIAGRAWMLNIGSKTPDGQSVYAARADDKTSAVCVVPLNLLEKASERVNDLRDKAALRFDKAAVTRMDLVHQGATPLTLAREATGWRLSGEIQDEADANSVMRLLDALAALRVNAADFIHDGVMGNGGIELPYGLDTPRFKLDVLEGTTRRSLLIGEDVKDHSDKCYVMRKGDCAVFAIEKQATEGLMKSAADLRSRTALEFNPDEVTAITIAPVAQPVIKLVHPKDRWQMEEPAGVTADSEQAVLFLSNLHDLEVTGWLDNPTPERLAECGLAAPQMTITLQTKPDAAPSVILFGKPGDKPDTCYARRGEQAPQQSASLHAAGQGPILIVPAGLLTNLAAGHLLFVSRTMLEFNKDDAVAVRIVRPEGAVALERSNDRWSVVAPMSAEANIPRVENLLYGLAFLDAARIEAEKVQSLVPYGLDAPRIKVTVSLRSAEAPKSGESAAPPVRKTVRIGKELPDGDSYAMMEGGERIFVLKGATVNLFLVDFVKAKKPESPKESR